MRHSAGSPASTGARQSTRSACSTARAKLWASGRSRTAGRASRPCAIGSCRLRATRARSWWRLRCRMDRWWMLFWTAASPYTRSIPSSSTGCATASASPGDDRRDARVAAAGLRTDRPLFRRVLAGDPSVIELREWSRLAEELQHERVRLGNRVRQQLWRYYPQLLELSDDVTAEWVLALWSMAPTPAKAARLREAMLARLLQEHRIRRLDAERAPGVFRVRRACSTAWRWKSSAHPDGGEGLAKRKGVAVRRGLKEAW